ncbi:conserved Plasmodium protein, unknown function [Plasmodium ovale]|uniref:Uncharacterized protein n=2 Tax=Plasmodium ovale TaxID=36330 RepID=A0A1A8VZJ9_PLAOA|nr:conserved Plasmodium protein, unknown function [Plasmodium ovale curtisi]SBS84813.1 conserved Plasmodium protein, unknown function [Plasmodium ovale curtisi]SCQ16057.1 conserved Plasmodium protein, unknown function [Plasmodium ovale]
MVNKEVEAIEKEFKTFYNTFMYIDENTFRINIITKDEDERKSFLDTKETNNILSLVITLERGYFEVLNKNFQKYCEKKFENIEQIFNTFCPITFKNFIACKVKSKLNLSL